MKSKSKSINEESYVITKNSSNKVKNDKTLLFELAIMKNIFNQATNANSEINEEDNLKLRKQTKESVKEIANRKLSSFKSNKTIKGDKEDIEETNLKSYSNQKKNMPVRKARESCVICPFPLLNINPLDSNYELNETSNKSNTMNEFKNKPSRHSSRLNTTQLISKNTIEERQTKIENRLQSFNSNSSIKTDKNPHIRKKLTRTLTSSIEPDDCNTNLISLKSRSSKFKFSINEDSKREIESLKTENLVTHLISPENEMPNLSKLSNFQTNKTQEPSAFFSKSTANNAFQDSLQKLEDKKAIADLIQKKMNNIIKNKENSKKKTSALKNLKVSQYWSVIKIVYRTCKFFIDLKDNIRERITGTEIQDFNKGRAIIKNGLTSDKHLIQFPFISDKFLSSIISYYSNKSNN